MNELLGKFGFFKIKHRFLFLIGLLIFTVISLAGLYRLTMFLILKFWKCLDALGSGLKIQQPDELHRAVAVSIQITTDYRRMYFKIA